MHRICDMMEHHISTQVLVVGGVRNMERKKVKILFFLR